MDKTDQMDKIDRLVWDGNIDELASQLRKVRTRIKKLKQELAFLKCHWFPPLDDTGVTEADLEARPKEGG